MGIQNSKIIKVRFCICNLKSFTDLIFKRWYISFKIIRIFQSYEFIFRINSFYFYIFIVALAVTLFVYTPYRFQRYKTTTIGGMACTQCYQQFALCFYSINSLVCCINFPSLESTRRKYIPVAHPETFTMY